MKPSGRRTLFSQRPQLGNTMDIERYQCKSVLLIEDNELDAYLTSHILRDRETKIAVEIARSAEEGLGKVRERRYDLIICDYRLPGMDGFSFLKLVKRMRDNMPVILLTGYPSPDLEAQVIRHGSCTYSSKAVDRQTFNKIIIESLSPTNQLSSI
jgi:CheY-like chemotaxis protein